VSPRWPVVLVLALLAGCATPAASTRSVPAPPPTPAWPLPAESLLEHGLEVETLWLGGARPGDPVPTIVALHGLGDRPDRFAWVFDGYPHPARVLLPRAPVDFGEGGAWMTVRVAEGRAGDLAMETAWSAARVAALCDGIAAEGTPPVVTGFSQGGMLAYAVAARHPDSIAAAVPVAGMLPAPLHPPAGAPVAPVDALHGEADSLVPLTLAVETVTALEGHGTPVSLRIFPGVDHRVPAPLRTAWHQLLARHTGAAP
jgi:phospholipase/carboxylesterase